MGGRWYRWTGAGRARAGAAPKKDTTPDASRRDAS